MGKMVEERSDDIKNQMGTKEYRNYKSQAQPLPRHVMETPPGLISRIVSEVVSLSELEPCGVRGGTIVVMFSPNHQPVGRIQLDPSTVPTFQLNLTILPLTDFRHGCDLSTLNGEIFWGNSLSI